MPSSAKALGVYGEMVINSGTLLSASSHAIYMYSGGTVTVGAGATINGRTRCY